MNTLNSDWVRRGIRSFVQGFIGVLALLALPILNQWVTSVGSGGEVIIDVPFWRSVAMAAVGGGVVSLVAFIQNGLEDNTKMPALLKAPASGGQNPAPDGL